MIRHQLLQSRLRPEPPFVPVICASTHPRPSMTPNISRRHFTQSSLAKAKRVKPVQSLTYDHAASGT
ncbi:MAG: hypothetical protein ACK56I_11070, partial [bacterium]